MASVERVEQVRSAFAAMAAGNPAAFFSLLADDLSYTVIGSTVFSGTVRSKDQFLMRVLVPLGEALATPLALELQHVIEDGERIAVQARATSTLKSGAPYNNVYCFVFRFDGGLIVEVTEYLDTAMITRAFGVPADREALLRAMDFNMWDMFREDVRLARGGELFETVDYWFGHSPRGTEFHNPVMVRRPIDADVLLEAVRRFYEPRRSVYSIWVRNHADGDLEAELRDRGFVDFTSMPGMVLLGDPGIECAPADLEIRPVVDDHGRRDFLHVNAEAYATYGSPRAYAEDAFTSLESVHAPHIQAFLGCVAGKPVAGAALYHTHGVAGIGWVGTLPEQRKRGYAEAVTWAAVREGFRRGAAFANLQASAMGAPIYERMGFVTMTEYRVLVPQRA